MRNFIRPESIIRVEARKEKDHLYFTYVPESTIKTWFGYKTKIIPKHFIDNYKQKCFNLVKGEWFNIKDNKVFVKPQLIFYSEKDSYTKYFNTNEELDLYLQENKSLLEDFIEI